MTEANKNFPELKFAEALVFVPLVGLIIFGGLYPKPMLDRIEPSVKALVAHVAAHTDLKTTDVPAPPASDAARGAGPAGGN